MNWGKGIIVVLIAFILFISGMAVYMFLSPQDDYDHQYYEKGLKFNRDYDREQQVLKDHAAPLIRVIDRQIKLTFKEYVIGTVKFERPSNNMLDKFYSLDSRKGNEIDIPLGSIASGQWKLVFNWVSNRKSYLYEEEIFIK
jgi:hypothetical protein